MYRIIFTILAIILELLLPRRRYRRGLWGFYNYGYDEWAQPVQNPNNGMAASIRASVRRKNALKKCKKFLTKDSYILTLKNANLILVFDTQNKTLSCVDNHTKGRAATVVWSDQIDATLDKNDNLFEQTFDDICISFDQYSNYTGVLKVLKQKFKVQETKPLKNVIPPSVYNTDKIKLDNNREDIYNKRFDNTAEVYSLKVNINSASEEEIAKLPGISVIIAKKIIQYRQLNNGFKTQEEFFEKMNIKPHFQKTLSPMIIIKEAKKKKNKPQNDERIIDF